jgi:DNA-binding LacI/PurR family transcriptional regulator
MKTVLYLHLSSNPVMHRRFLDGMRRFARTAGWRVEPVLIDSLSPAALRARVSKGDVIGCVRGSGRPHPDCAVQSFCALDVPIVWLEPSEADLRRSAGAVFCDHAAIAKAAFRELSAGHPPSFAAVDYWDPAQRWARERIAAFRALCAEAGCECTVFTQPRLEMAKDRLARLAEWAANLPNHVAIFAANDFTAVETAIALYSRHRPIPKTATLVGVDGSPERHDIPPSPVPISSVNVNFESAGFLAARMLWNTLAQRSLSPEANTAIFGPLMVIRHESTRGRGRRDPRIIEAVETIRREACNGLTAAKLAALYDGSRKHFERRFREATGHSVLDEILNIRLEQVQACLLRRDIAIDAIAGLCGFGSEIELRRLFRRRFRSSMTEWRARNSL